jgi:hypothetical protein
VKTPLRRLIAGLTLTLATATGYAVTHDTIAHPAGDTAWGAPDTTDAGPVVTETIDDASRAIATPLDTAWG